MIYNYELFPILLNMSITASIAVFVIIIMRKIFRNMPKVIFYAMWFVVLFRLLCPVSLPSDFSFMNMLNMPAYSAGKTFSSMDYIPQDIVHTEYPEVDLPVPLVSDIVNHFLPQGNEQLAAGPLKAPVALATNIWLIGAAVMLIYGITSFIKLKKEIAGYIHLKANIYLCDYISSPFVIGFIRPKIFLPSFLSENEQKYVIMHENYHIKRFDHIVKLIAFTALCIHWFNPVMWLMFSLFSKDMEMSCDEAVIKTLGRDIRSEYSASLLNLATGKHIFAGTPLAFGEGDTSERIKNLYNYRKPAIIVAVAFSAICITLCGSLLLNPDNSRGEILFNGMIYTQCGKSQSQGINGSKNIGNILTVVEKKAELKENLSAKNIKDIYAGMPVFQFQEKPEYLYLTTGEGWIPFKAYSMDYSKTENYIFISGENDNVTIDTNFNEDINEIRIYEDVYEFGKLVSSNLIAYSNSTPDEYGVNFERNESFSMTLDYDFNTQKLTHKRYEDGVISTMYADIPDKEYTSWSKNLATSTGRHEILANDSIDLMYIILSSYPDGAIYVNYMSENNDTVVVYRLVTSSVTTR